MASVFTIQGPELGGKRRKKGRKSKRSSGALAAKGDCKCIWNKKTKMYSELCFVGKSKKSRSGWKFMKGGNDRCARR